MGAFTDLPRWVTVGENKRAGFVWRDLATDLWHAHCAKGRLAFGAVEEAERAIARWPAAAPQPQQKPRVKPLDHSRRSDLRSGFIVRDGKGRELGGAIGRPGGSSTASPLARTSAGSPTRRWPRRRSGKPPSA